MSYSYDYINGKQTLQMVVTSDTTLTGSHQGTIHVEQGVLTISGEVHGTLDVQSGTKVIISGKQFGTVSIAKNAIAIVNNELFGTVSVSDGGMLEVSSQGKLFGTLCNLGKVVIMGTYKGVHSGNELIIKETGRIISE